MTTETAAEKRASEYRRIRLDYIAEQERKQIETSKKAREQSRARERKTQAQAEMVGAVVELLPNHGDTLTCAEIEAALDCTEKDLLALPGTSLSALGLRFTSIPHGDARILMMQRGKPYTGSPVVEPSF